jgi:hypothetical protein
MKIHPSHTTFNARTGRGPSLYGVETPGKDPLEGLRILGTLESGRSRSGVGKVGVAVLLIVLLLLPASYLIVTSPSVRQSLPQFRQMAKELTGKGGKDRPIASSAIESSVTVASTAVTQEDDRATIVMDPASVPSAVQEALAASIAESRPIHVQLPVIMEPEVEQAKTPEPVPEPAHVGPTVVQAAPARRAVPAHPRSTRPAAIARSRRDEHKQTAAGRAPVGAVKDARYKENGKDKRVDLNGAALTHISRPGEAISDVTTKQGPMSALAVATTSGKRDGQGVNRDIVLPSPGESRESLIGRCRSLGFLEGELCRIRICSGSWGNDPACPMETAVRGE